MTHLDRRLSIAPMMDWTDRHYRYLMRFISRRVLLYTEMVHCGAILHGDRDFFLDFSPEEHPIALQLGGCVPQDLAECSRIAQAWGYDEVNLNVGCPSPRVQRGRFGACLMAEPALVAECVAAMQQAVTIPITVKTRIGIDDNDDYHFLAHFVETVANAGCEVFIIHARKAWLQGLSPKQNREIPPLDYERVYRLKRDFPQLQICINGGITSLDATQAHLAQVDGVMLGRIAYQQPYLLSEADQRIFQTQSSVQDRFAVIDQLLPYIEQQMQKGLALSRITRHLLGLFQGLPGAKQYRRYLSENAHRQGATIDTLLNACQFVLET